MIDKNGNTISDSVYGSMCWCPITNLDVADAAYEWNMGQYMSSGTRAEGTFTKSLSIDLAKAYGENVKNVDFTTVWAQGHTQAERTGNSSSNFINWVNECMN